MALWDDAMHTPIGVDGRPAIVGHIGNRDQAERWHAAGYSIPEATARYEAFFTRWEDLVDADEAAADRLVDDFYSAERQLAADAGLQQDTDFWRLESARKHFL